MSSEPKSNAAAVPAATSQDKRRSQRVVIRIPVRVHFVLDSKPGVLEATTVVVNDHGCMMICARVFAVGTRLQIEIVSGSSPATAGSRQFGHVLRPPRMTPLGFEVPVEFERVIPGFWGIAFPPADWAPPQK